MYMFKHDLQNNFFSFGNVMKGFKKPLPTLRETTFFLKKKMHLTKEKEKMILTKIQNIKIKTGYSHFKCLKYIIIKNKTYL